jgi:hypothetical protein
LVRAGENALKKVATLTTWGWGARVGAGFTAPFIFGDGGRAKEEAATSYAYRIKNVYPTESQ